MRITKLAVVAAGLTLGLAACSSSGSPSGSAAPGASGSAGASAGASSGGGATSGGGVANSCVVGTWKSTGVNMTFDSNGAHGTASGGTGLTLTVAPDGKTVVDFTGMQPIMFDTSVNGTNVKGRFSYGGKVNGAVQVPSTATSTGVWKPVGRTDWSTLTVTVELLSPVQSKIFDNVKISDFANAAGDQTGGSVDVQPILHDATYECSGNTLKLGPPAGTTSSGGTWVLERA
jgi:hypothetical protein